MPLFTFEEIEESSQAAVKKAFNIKTQDSRLLDAKSMTKLSVGDFNEPLVVLGHTQVVHKEGLLSNTTRMTVHDMSAKAMAEKFAKSVSEKDRAKVADIYLFACEAGLKDSSESPCFARKFAHEMHKKGFVNLQVHAITSPADGPDFTSMRLEVTHKAGKRAAVEVGHTRAFMTTQEYENNAVRLEELQSQLDLIPTDNIKRTAERTSLHKEIQSITKHQRALADEGLIMEGDAAKAEFDRPENTFKSNAKIHAISAQEKVFQTEHGQVSAATLKTDVIRFIEEERGASQDKKYTKNLQNLQQKIEGADENWQKPIFDAMSKYTNTHNPTKQAKTSTFYTFLKTLSENFSLNSDVTHNVTPTPKEEKPKASENISPMSETPPRSESRTHETAGLAQPKSNLKNIIKFVEHLEKDHIEDFIQSGATPQHYKNWENAIRGLETSRALIQDDKSAFEQFSLVSNYLYSIKGACYYLDKKPNPERQVELDAHIELALEKMQVLHKFADVVIPSDLGIKPPVPPVDEPKETAPLLPIDNARQRSHASQTPEKTSTHSLGDIKEFYAFKDRAHSSPARSEIYDEKGDALKQKILEKFKSQIEQTENSTDLHNTVVRIKNSDEYRILETGQDRFTRIFGLKTSSVKAFESMVEEQEAYLCSNKKTM